MYVTNRLAKRNRKQEIVLCSRLDRTPFFKIVLFEQIVVKVKYKVSLMFINNKVQSLKPKA